MANTKARIAILRSIYRELRDIQRESERQARTTLTYYASTKDWLQSDVEAAITAETT